MLASDSVPCCAVQVRREIFPSSVCRSFQKENFVLDKSYKVVKALTVEFMSAREAFICVAHRYHGRKNITAVLEKPSTEIAVSPRRFWTILSEIRGIGRRRPAGGSPSIRRVPVST